MRKPKLYYKSMTSAFNAHSLQNCTVVVTGATGGIGLAIVAAAISDGAFVIACGRNKEKLEALSTKFEGDIHPLCYDVTDEAAIKNAFQCVQRGASANQWPALYGLVNAAGAMTESKLAMTSTKMLQQQMMINFYSPYYHTQIASRLMSRYKAGSIVNIVSQVSEQGCSGMSAYSASKAALTVATKSLAKELATTGIRVNAVAPGFIDTPLTAHYDESAKQSVYERTVLRRGGTTKEVANAVLYLLSPRASYTTGHVLPVDGQFCP